MTDLDWLIAPETARMSEDDFAELWAALGTVIRIRSRYAQPAPAPAPKRDPASTVAAKIERSPARKVAASPAGCGFQAPGMGRG